MSASPPYDEGMPDDLIEVRACATMAGVSYGEIIWVEENHPEIQTMLNAQPPLLERVEPAESGP